ncbi:hypothetical protein RHSIM_Rhsim09G0155200 [Rhododendron simsii]|uniref:Translation initiation factor 3 N-terminal domain-containing protein n=1 Tax=Rhododendron simsii TaxID=118357 RepID=A0A834GD96_RHOSS|nr:hypothetical protein RHSIM_Rhsim09G0155200 [Rhododendron simsii]
MTYRPFDSFLEEYRTVLPSSCTSEWNFRFQLAVWLDGIMYYSFLQYSEEGHRVLSRTGVLDRVRRLNVDLVEVQRNAKPPVCKLADYHKEKYKQQIKEKDRAESKVITVSIALATHYQIKTAWLPSVLLADAYPLQFAYVCTLQVSFSKVFAHRFKSFFHDQIIAEIIFRMNNFEWKVPRQNGHLQPIGMEVLQNRLRLQDSDLVFVAIKNPSEIRLLVLSSDRSEKMCFWF